MYVYLKMLSGVQSFWRHAKTLEQCKISELPPNTHCVINMMFIYKITELKIYMLLGVTEHHDVTFTENHATAYTPCLRPHRKLILADILLKFSQTNLKIMYIQEIVKFW